MSADGAGAAADQRQNYSAAILHTYPPSEYTALEQRAVTHITRAQSSSTSRRAAKLQSTSPTAHSRARAGVTVQKSTNEEQ